MTKKSYKITDEVDETGIKIKGEGGDGSSDFELEIPAETVKSLQEHLDSSDKKKKD